MLLTAVADGAPTAREWTATSSASGAAKTGTSSVRRSARTPSTRQPSTSSRPSLRKRIARAISTWALVPGTRRARSRNRRQLTGHHCQTLNRAKSADGRSPCSKRAGISAAASGALTVEARNPRVARLGLARRDVESHTAPRGLQGPWGYRWRREPLPAVTHRHENRTFLRKRLRCIVSGGCHPCRGQRTPIPRHRGARRGGKCRHPPTTEALSI